MKKYIITFVEKTKYHPATRTCTVEAENEQNAKLIVAAEFDKIKYNAFNVPYPAEKRIMFKSIKEVKEEDKAKE